MKSKDEEIAGYSVGQEGNLPTAPTIPASLAPTSGGRSVPEVGGENAFGQNAQPERSSSITEYQPRASNLPQTISARSVADDGWDYTNIWPGAK